MSLVTGYPSHPVYHSIARDFYQHRYTDDSRSTAMQLGPGSALLQAQNAGASAAADPTSASYFQNLMFGPATYGVENGIQRQYGSDAAEMTSSDGYSGSAGYLAYDEMTGLMLTGTDGGGGSGVEDGVVPRVRTVKRRVSSNRKERRRTHSINTAFAALRSCIPNVPADTKLSKIKTLRLATSYIAYLMDILNKDDPKLAEGGFKADITRKIESREEKRKRESEEILKACGSLTEERPSRGRTGWPQQVWAAELKQ